MTTASVLSNEEEAPVSAIVKEMKILFTVVSDKSLNTFCVNFPYSLVVMSDSYLVSDMINVKSLKPHSFATC